MVRLVSSGQRVDGNVLRGRGGSHGVDGKCEVWSCSHHLEMRNDYTPGLSLPSQEGPPG